MDWILLGVGLLLCVGTGIFVATEFTLVNLDRHELETRSANGEKRLGPVIGALKETSTHLSGAQLGITLTTLLTGYTMEPAISSLLGDALIAAGLGTDWVSGVGTVIAMVVATFCSMVIGELIPKNFALSLPAELAKIVVPAQNVFTTVFRPAIRALNGSANWLIRRMGIEPKEELSGARTAEELSSLVRRSALVGVLDTDKAVLLNRTLRFSEHTADEVMTPRPRVSVIGADATVDELIRLAHDTGYSRFPVTGEDIDDVIGIAHLKYAIAVPPERRASVPVGAIKTDAVFVPESIALDALLGEVRGEGYQLAIVLDEYGGTAGIVTLEDLVEEIVGELVDEHDRAHMNIIRTRNRITFDGLLRPDELRDRLNIDIEDDGPYETVAGFVMHNLARVPTVGEHISVDEGTLTVEEMEGRRISRIRFTPNSTYETREERIRRERDHDDKGARA